MVPRHHHHLQLLFSLSGPCPPEGVQVSLECASNVGTVSWFSAVAADLYEATLRTATPTTAAPTAPAIPSATSTVARPTLSQ